jgi:organic hydroperoxide reductase OsmC/OhrA
MVVVSSRQTGERPETIRTRIARFMPNRASTGWSISWSAQTERADDIANDDELRAAEHLGCYGAAVAHALGQAEISPLKLLMTAEAGAAPDGARLPITVEIRVQLPRPMLDQTVVEAIARRAEPSCPVWRSLASELGVNVIAVLDEPPAAEAVPGQAPATPAARQAAPPTQAPARPALPKLSPISGGRLAFPKWLTPRMAILIGLAVGVFAVAPKPPLFG